MNEDTSTNVGYAVVAAVTGTVTVLCQKFIPKLFTYLSHESKAKRENDRLLARSQHEHQDEAADFLLERYRRYLDGQEQRISDQEERIAALELKVAALQQSVWERDRQLTDAAAKIANQEAELAILRRRAG